MAEQQEIAEMLPNESKLRSPRAAAIAGIVFALLSIAREVLVRRAFPDDLLVGTEWLAAERGELSLAISLIPFAGIAFLWFMAVVRDRMGHYEDQFFSMLFFGSGLLYLATTFVSAAVAGSALILYAVDHEQSYLGSGIYSLSLIIASQLNTVFAMRMAGMFMFVLGTIWLRTKVMPRWLAWVTYLIALALFISMNFTFWIFLVFPIWVLLVSIAILVQNYRQRTEQQPAAE